MENELISIIIPCYNVYRYINDVFESLKNQTYQNFEAIFVDDGSLDSTGKLIDDFCDNFPKAKVIHQANAGLASARNSGLKLAKGEFILFLDSDDAIKPNALKVLHDAIITESADIAIGKLENVKDNFKYSSIEKHKKYKKKLFVNADKLVSQYLSCNVFLPQVWNKLYRHEVLKRFDSYPNVFNAKRLYMEDVLFQVKYFSLINKAIYVPYKFYYYRHVKNSMSRVMFKESMLTIFDGNEFYPFLDSNLFVESQIYINAKYATDNLELLFRIRNSDYSNPALVRQMYANYKKYLKYCFKAKRSQWYRKYLMWMSRPFLYLLIRKKMK